MSDMLYAIIKYEENTSDEAISDSCFDFVAEACAKKIALGMISKRVSICDGENYFNYITPINYILNSLKKNEIVIELSNSYVYGEAEKILSDDYSVPYPPHIERLKNLQELLEYILNIPIVRELNVYMCDDYYGEDDFITVHSSISEFAVIMKEKLFQKYSFAYKCIINKPDEMEVGECDENQYLSHDGEWMEGMS